MSIDELVLLPLTIQFLLFHTFDKLWRAHRSVDSYDVIADPYGIQTHANYVNIMCSQSVSLQNMHLRQYKHQVGRTFVLYPEIPWYLGLSSRRIHCCILYPEYDNGVKLTSALE